MARSCAWTGPLAPSQQSVATTARWRVQWNRIRRIELTVFHGGHDGWTEDDEPCVLLDFGGLTAFVAEHLQAAGDLHPAFGWHMRAATCATNRDIAAARLSWERARKIADTLPGSDPDRPAMRIAPRTMLCGTAFRVRVKVAGERFEELRQLCTAAGTRPHWPSVWRGW